MQILCESELTRLQEFSLSANADGADLVQGFCPACHGMLRASAEDQTGFPAGLLRGHPGVDRVWHVQTFSPRPGVQQAGQPGRLL